MLLFLSVNFVEFPSRSDSILENSKGDVIVEASGSLGVFMGDSKCHQTFPNQTLVGEKKMDWCSNLGDRQSKPWITFSIRHKAMKLTGYSVRNGCCYYYCCCDSQTGEVFDYDCCCRLYSFSLQGSNDNKTWVTIHSISKDSSFFRCEFKTYEFAKSQSFNFIRFLMDEPRPGYQNCMQINQIELYGETLQTLDGYSFEDDEQDETVSIIGKIKND